MNEGFMTVKNDFYESELEVQQRIEKYGREQVIKALTSGYPIRRGANGQKLELMITPELEAFLNEFNITIPKSWPYDKRSGSVGWSERALD